MAKKKRKEHGDNVTDVTPLTEEQKKMLDALEKSKAVVARACKRIGYTRQTHYRWLENETYAEAYKNIKESAIDFVEGKMFDRIEEGSDGLIKFYLSTIGRSRGYVEKTQHEHKGSVRFDGFDFGEDG